MNFRRLPLVIAIGSLAFITACGSSNDSAALSDAEFCQEIERLDSIEPTNEVDSAVAILRNLIDKAPNDDIRQALLVMQPAFEGLATLDENDSEAMTQFLDLLMDEEIVAASETLDRYSKDVCGFADSATGDTLG